MPASCCLGVMSGVLVYMSSRAEWKLVRLRSRGVGFWPDPFPLLLPSRRCTQALLSVVRTPPRAFAKWGVVLSRQASEQ